jgi:hypothetical protein
VSRRKLVGRCCRAAPTWRRSTVALPSRRSGCGGKNPKKRKICGKPNKSPLFLFQALSIPYFLRRKLNTFRHELNTYRRKLNSLRRELNSFQRELNTYRHKLNSFHRDLNTFKASQNTFLRSWNSWSWEWCRLAGGESVPGVRMTAFSHAVAGGPGFEHKKAAFA